MHKFASDVTSVLYITYYLWLKHPIDIIHNTQVILSSDMKALLARVRQGQPRKPAKLQEQPQTERELVDLSNTQ